MTGQISKMGGRTKLLLYYYSYTEFSHINAPAYIIFLIGIDLGHRGIPKAQGKLYLIRPGVSTCLA